jgi:membrane protease YdiL (CAAX protease family)
LPETLAQGIDMGKLFDNTYYLPVFISIALFKGGFSEELWRIFTLTRFEKIFGKSGLLLALIFSSVVFGVGHLYQGVEGMISTAIVGLLYALVYLRKRLALESIFAHAIFNMIAVILGYIVY